MRSVLFVALAALAVPRIADACSYMSSYNSPGPPSGACEVEATVAGCPIHVLIPHDEVQLVMPTVQRNGTQLATTATVTTVGSFTQQLTSTDYFSCDCTETSFAEQFDQLEIAVAAGTQEGDVVTVGNLAIAVGPAGTCETLVWPTMVDFERGGCDRCPIDPIDPPIDPVGDDAGDGGGCNTGGAAGLGAALLGLLALRRRR